MGEMIAKCDLPFLIDHVRIKGALQRLVHNPWFFSAAAAISLTDESCWFTGFGGDSWSDFLNCLFSLKREMVEEIISTPQSMDQHRRLLDFQELNLVGASWKKLEKR